MSQKHTDAMPASYFQQRMELLGVTDELNVIHLKQTEIDPNSPDRGNTVLKPFQVFRESDRGIDILLYTIDRNVIRTTKELQRNSHTIKAADKLYCVTRLENPIVKKDGKEIKYLMPGKEPTRPFFPPKLVAKYDKAKAWLEANPGKRLPAELRIGALYITEGAFKAFKASMHGIDCVGLPSITCMRNNETGELYEDIQKLLLVCEVERAIYLTDGDCRNITAKEIHDGEDLYKRPKNFFDTVRKFNELLSKFPDIEKFFAHIHTDNFTEMEGDRVVVQGPKGLDDLLCKFPERAHEIAMEFSNFSRLGTKGKVEGAFLVRINISYNLNRINEYFYLNNVDQFYLFHSERRKDLREAKNFKFNGTLYHYDLNEGKCVIDKPGDADRYFRVGDTYYEWLEVPNRNGELERTYQKRDKTTITDDHGKKILEHIPKYKAPCIVPDHQNYQLIHSYCFNKYFPLRHYPEAGDCDVSLNFVKHIFGDVDVTYTDDAGQKQTIKRYELGLDYMALLYLKPTHILPILCLVSELRQTGKTTYTDWLNDIFGENVANVGNSDLQNDFNSHWVPKLIIACDETKIDKDETVEKVKRLSTSRKVVMNAKGKDQINCDFFAKFIFLSNNTKSFLNIHKDEIRFWVIEVPKIEKINISLLDDLRDEIPAFLHFLANRPLATKSYERHWFKSEMLVTKALIDLKAHSRPALEKRIIAEVGELFQQSGAETLTIPTKGLLDMLKGIERNYLLRTLDNMGYVQQKQARGKYPRVGEEGIPGSLSTHITTKWIQFNTTYYLFKREDFTPDPAQPDKDNETSDSSNNEPKTVDDLPF